MIDVDLEYLHQVDFRIFNDLDPNKISSIYTTLMFIVDECNTH